MAVLLTDNEIALFTAEPKRLQPDFLVRSWPKRKRGHREADVVVQGDGGRQFRIITRMAEMNQLDFSVILAVQLTSRLFRLRRYNGNSHEHTNRIEASKIEGFHVHLATERYQALGMSEDAYAEPSSRYCDLNGAIQCLVDDCGCVFAKTTFF